MSGDLTDVVSNIGLVRAFGAARREQERLSGKIDHEMSAQRDSLRSLERLRLFHAVSVFVVTAGVLAGRSCCGGRPRSPPAMSC